MSPSIQLMEIISITVLGGGRSEMERARSEKRKPGAETAA